jgi:hypothetical protein
MFEPIPTTNGTITTTPTTTSESATSTQIDQIIRTVHILQRKVLLLTNRLNYELFLKQQYTRHIGRLHRDRLMDAAVEAERQGLVSLNNSIRKLLGYLC